jgi:hypothetical protein
MDGWISAQPSSIDMLLHKIYAVRAPKNEARPVQRAGDTHKESKKWVLSLKFRPQPLSSSLYPDHHRGNFYF